MTDLEHNPMSLRQFEYFFVEKFLLNSDFDRLPGNSNQPQAAASNGGSVAAAVNGGGAAAEDGGQPVADGAAAAEDGGADAAEDSSGAAAEDSAAAEKALVEKMDGCAQDLFDKYDYGAQFPWPRVSSTSWMSQPISIQHSAQ